MTATDGRRADDTRRNRILRKVQLVINVVAVVALAVAIYGLTQITASRRGSAHDSCELLRGLVYASTFGNPQGRGAAQAYVDRTPLHNCNAYARHIVR